MAEEEDSPGEEAGEGISAAEVVEGAGEAEGIGEEDVGAGMVATTEEETTERCKITMTMRP